MVLVTSSRSRALLELLLRQQLQRSCNCCAIKATVTALLHLLHLQHAALELLTPIVLKVEATLQVHHLKQWPTLPTSPRAREAEQEPKRQEAKTWREDAMARQEPSTQCRQEHAMPLALYARMQLYASCSGWRRGCRGRATLASYAPTREGYGHTLEVVA